MTRTHDQDDAIAMPGEDADVRNRVAAEGDETREGAGSDRAELVGASEKVRVQARRLTQHLGVREHLCAEPELAQLVVVHLAEQIGAEARLHPGVAQDIEGGDAGLAHRAELVEADLGEPERRAG